MIQHNNELCSNSFSSDPSQPFLGSREKKSLFFIYQKLRINEILYSSHETRFKLYIETNTTLKKFKEVD